MSELRLWRWALVATLLVLAYAVGANRYEVERCDPGVFPPYCFVLDRWTGEAHIQRVRLLPEIEKRLQEIGGAH